VRLDDFCSVFVLKIDPILVHFWDLELWYQYLTMFLSKSFNISWSYEAKRRMCHVWVKDQGTWRTSGNFGDSFRPAKVGMPWRGCLWRNIFVTFQDILSEKQCLKPFWGHISFDFIQVKRWGFIMNLPSGNLTVRYWTWPSRNSGFSH
jgi:hypothetical protein